MVGLRMHLVAVNLNQVECPSCGEWFEVSQLAPEDFGGELDYDCAVC